MLLANQKGSGNDEQKTLHRRREKAKGYLPPYAGGKTGRGFVGTQTMTPTAEGGRGKVEKEKKEHDP